MEGVCTSSNVKKKKPEETPGNLSQMNSILLVVVSFLTQSIDTKVIKMI